MIKKKLLIVIAALLILNLSLAGCGKSTEANANNESSTTTSSSSSEDKTKELDKKYLEEIKPYLMNMSRDWTDFSKVCSSGAGIFNDNTKIKMATYFADIKENWKQLFDVKTETTPNILELKKTLENVKDLQLKAIDNYTEGLDNLNKEKIEKCNELLNQSNDIINNDLASLVKKMNE